jgi:hypothetical protein
MAGSSAHSSHKRQQQYYRTICVSTHEYYTFFEPELSFININISSSPHFSSSPAAIQHFASSLLARVRTTMSLLGCMYTTLRLLASAES